MALQKGNKKNWKIEFQIIPILNWSPRFILGEANIKTVGNDNMKKWNILLLGILIVVLIWPIIVGNSVSAWLAHRLLHTAWVRTQAIGQPVKPWPWANTWPIARLSVPHLNVEQIVLARAGEGMSVFALGHSNSSVLPGELGNSVLNIYHSDTFLGFLKKLKKGDMLVLESLDSRWHYQVSGTYVVDKTSTDWIAPCLKRRLTLIGCHSCNNLEDGLRYVVTAVEVERMV
jgi:sortase A